MLSARKTKEGHTGDQLQALKVMTIISPQGLAGNFNELKGEPHGFIFHVGEC
jgi:hypothetical protein